MKSILQTIALIVIIFAIALLAEQIAPLKQLTSYLNDHPQPYVNITIGIGIVGFVLLIVAWLIVLVRSSGPMSDAEAQEFARSMGRVQVGTFSGKAVGVTARGEVSFRAIKDALRSGEWRRDAGWWPFLLGLVGLPLAVGGMFGYFFVIGAPTVKLIVGAALAYAAVRFTWAWMRA